MEKVRKALTAKLDRLLDKPVVEDTLYWEDLGVDSFVVDEAHEFKNLPFATGLGQVAGLGAPQGSQRALDLLIKIRAMRRLHPDSRLAFLTGTPIANSVSEAHHTALPASGGPGRARRGRHRHLHPVLRPD